MITLLKKALLLMLAASGLLWLPFEVSNYHDAQHKLPESWYFIGLVIILLGVIARLLFYQKKFTYYFQQQGITFTVIIGDIFAFTDGAAISFSDTFDTEVSSRLISKHSLQAMFLKRVYADDTQTLDRDIRHTIRQSGITGTRDAAKKIGKDVRYPLGSVLPVEKNGKCYYLMAISKMGNDGIAQGTQEDFHKALCELWRTIDCTCDDETVSIPIIGTKKSRLYPDCELALKEIILSAYSYSRIHRRPAHHLRFVISKQDARHIDMLKLKDFVESLDTVADPSK
ncbi:MAG: macro domain-containing protein [Ktedonobacteraceae bacterium]